MILNTERFQNELPHSKAMFLLYRIAFHADT